MYIHGVPGKLSVVRNPDNPKLFDQQRWVSDDRQFIDRFGQRVTVQVVIEFDDECGNGHNSFSVMGRGRVLDRYHPVDIAGCCHEDIALGFPELAHLIPWHGCTTDGPTHYVPNTLYFAGDRDCWGLRKGEKSQIRNGKTGELMWVLETEDGRPIYELKNKHAHGDTPPADPPQLRWAPWCRVGEGKERDLDAARRAAKWPDVEDAILCMDSEDLEAALKDRLPSLIRMFRQVIEAAGLYWE